MQTQLSWELFVCRIVTDDGLVGTEGAASNLLADDAFPMRLELSGCETHLPPGKIWPSTSSSKTIRFLLQLHRLSRMWAGN